MARLLVGAFAVTLVSLAVGMTTASGDSGDVAADRGAAALDTKTVTATRRIISERDPAAPNDACFAAAFYEFPDVPGATSATLTFKLNGADTTRQSAPPYDDEYELYGKTFSPNDHWISAEVFGSAAGAGAGGHCDENVVPAIEAGTSSTGTVELTGEFKDECKKLNRSSAPACESDACDRAKEVAKKARKAIGAITGKLKNDDLSKAKEKKLEKALETALEKAKKAAKAINKKCDG